MGDEERGDIEASFPEANDVLRYAALNQDIFGDFHVVGPGVQIVLDGRPITIHRN